MRLAAGALALSLVLLAGALRAEPCRPPTSFTNKSVETLFEAGSEQLERARRSSAEARRQAASDAEQTFRKILHFYACLPSSVVLLAEALELQGKPYEALGQYQRLIDAEGELQDEFWRPSVLAARAGLARVKQRYFASFEVRLHERDCARAAPSAVIDGNPVRLDSQLTLEPGSHELRIEAAGCLAFTQPFTTTAGTERTLLVDLKRVPPPHAEHKVPTWVWVTAGAVAAVGAGVGIYFLAKPSPPPPPYDCGAALGAGFGCLELN